MPNTTLYTAGCLLKCTINDASCVVSVAVRNIIYTAVSTQYPHAIDVILDGITGSFGGLTAFIPVNDKLTMTQKITRYNVTRIVSTCNNPKHDSSIFDISHTIPRIFSGNTTHNNLTLECRQCNRERSSNVSIALYNLLQSYPLEYTIPEKLAYELTH